MEGVMENVEVARYPAYKDSGIDWLGEIPAHWQLLRNRALFRERKDSGNESLPILSVSIHTAVSSDELDEEDNIQGRNRIGDKSIYKRVEPNDIVFNMMRAWQGAIGSVQNEGMVSPAYTVARPNNSIHAKYFELLYRTLGFIQQMNLYSKGITDFRKRLYWPEFKNLITIVPPFHEQQAIVSFLDRKTAQIDNAIHIKERQIELLKERRQILIQNAVTRGLNEDGTLRQYPGCLPAEGLPVGWKESGVEWIGSIPEHWEVKKLKFLLKERLKYGANESGVAYDEKLPRYVRITDFGQDGRLSEENKLSLPAKKAADYLVEDGDILFARSGATVGKSYQFKRAMSIEKQYSFAGYLIKATVDEDKILSDYLYLYTSTETFVKWKDTIFIKATIENIGADKYAQLPVVLPPLDEQKTILAQCANYDSKINKAIASKNTEIEKLKEYKATLIDGVVTGKVKVE